MLTRRTQWSLLLLLCAMTGCSGGSLLNLRKNQVAVAGVDNPVVQVLTLWQPAEGRGIDGLTTRGFAGQIYFITAKNQMPAVVNGKVRITLFDDMGKPEERVKPLHQFDYSSEAWNTHRNDTKLGPAYSVFVPYVRKTTQQVKCSLHVRLTLEEGLVAQSELVNVLLPGTTASKTEPPATEAVETGTANQQVNAGNASPATGTAPTAIQQAAALQDLENLRNQLQRQTAGAGTTVTPITPPHANNLSVQQRQREVAARIVEQHLQAIAAEDEGIELVAGEYEDENPFLESAGRPDELIGAEYDASPMPSAHPLATATSPRVRQPSPHRPMSDARAPATTRAARRHPLGNTAADVSNHPLTRGEQSVRTIRHTPEPSPTTVQPVQPAQPVSHPLESEHPLAGSETGGTSESQMKTFTIPLPRSALR